MELFKASALQAMALCSLLVITATFGALASTSTAVADADGGGAAMTPSDEYYDDMAPSLRRLARAMVMRGSGHGDNHTAEQVEYAGSTGRMQGCAEKHFICPKINPHWRCCGMRCVDVETDEFNCGHCEKRCSYRHKCCRGKCVDVMYDKHNCGSCGKRCKHSKCVYGMCSYSS